MAGNTVRCLPGGSFASCKGELQHGIMAGATCLLAVGDSRQVNELNAIPPTARRGEKSSSSLTGHFLQMLFTRSACRKIIVNYRENV